MNAETCTVVNILILIANTLVTSIGVALNLKLYTEILKNDGMNRRQGQTTKGQIDAKLG
jgi:hypothetical protein